MREKVVERKEKLKMKDAEVRIGTYDGVEVSCVAGLKRREEGSFGVAPRALIGWTMHRGETCSETKNYEMIN